MDDNLITALEASWEIDPVLMDGELWRRIEGRAEKREGGTLTNETKNAKMLNRADEIRLNISVSVHL